MPVEIHSVHLRPTDFFEANPSIEYIATGPDPMMSRANGKALIQYDPEARLDCNSQIAGVELWFEDHPRQRYTDTWTAFPNQQVPFHKTTKFLKSTSGIGMY